MKKLILLAAVLGLLVAGCREFGWKPDEPLTELTQCKSDELACREYAFDKCNIGTPGNVTSYAGGMFSVGCITNYYNACMEKKGYTQKYSWKHDCPVTDFGR